MTILRRTRRPATLACLFVLLVSCGENGTEPPPALEHTFTVRLTVPGVNQWGAAMIRLQGLPRGSVIEGADDLITHVRWDDDFTARIALFGPVAPASSSDNFHGTLLRFEVPEDAAPDDYTATLLGVGALHYGYLYEPDDFTDDFYVTVVPSDSTP